nr:ESPR domain-containing protein [Citrobacter sp. L55]
MMKRNLNTSYRLVWNEVLGAFVVVSELAKAKESAALLFSRWQLPDWWQALRHWLMMRRETPVR